MKKPDFSTKGKTIFTVVTLLLVLVVIFSGTVKAELTEEALQVRCFGGKTEIPYENIQSVQLLEDFSPGKRNIGAETLRIDSGTYYNKQLGYYKISAVKSHDVYILLQREGEEEFVFNLPEEQSTREIYQKLLQLTE